MNVTMPSFHPSCLVSAFTRGKRMKGLLGCALVALVTGPSLLAQSSPTALRAYSISTFATGGVTNTDYGINDYGLTFGTDIRKSMRFIEPSLELRSTMTSGNVVRESSLDGGLKLEKGFGRVHPYGDLLFGYGTITFPGRTMDEHDNSAVWNYGGGVEYQVSRSFFVKADIQLQSWQLGHTEPVFHPMLSSVGFTYRPMMRNIVR